MTTTKTYKELKERYPESIILVRTGKFYTSYDDDAEVVARTLGITLTKPDGKRQASFPYNYLDTFLPRLVRAGKKVAICDDVPELKELVKPNSVKI